MNKCKTLIDNSDAPEFIQNNSQWHPGWISQSAVTEMLPPGTLPTVSLQQTAPTTTDQSIQIGDEAEDEDEGEDEDEDEDEDENENEAGGEGEGEGEVDEEMDDFDDALDADALDEDGEASIAANGQSVLLTNAVGAAPSQALANAIDPTVTEQLLSLGNSFSGDEGLDLPDLEEMPVVGQTDQQTIEGNDYLQHRFDQLADNLST